ncbi:phospholipase-like protein [Tanacetum coccineum]
MIFIVTGGDGCFCFDSEGGATNPESNKDKLPTLADVLDEVRALRKEVALVMFDDARILKLERILNDNFMFRNDISPNGNHNAVNQGLSGSANYSMSTCSRPDIDNAEVAGHVIGIHKADGKNDSPNANQNGVKKGLSCSANDPLSTCSSADILDGEVADALIRIHKADGKNDSPNVNHNVVNKGLSSSATGVITFYDSLSWVCKNRRPWWRTMKRTLPHQLTLYLNEHEVLQSKGIAVEIYEIKYMFPKVVRQADDYGDCGVSGCIFLYRLSRNLPLIVDDPLQTALAYRERMLQYFWRHKIQPEKTIVLDEDYIPFEMQIEIMNRLPVKSLLQFRTVSKSWKSCIDSSAFFFKYGVRKSLNDVFYLTYNHGFQGSMICVDDNLIHTPALTNLHIVNLKPIGTSQGIWCSSYGNNMMVSIANPSIRKKVGVFVLNSQPDSCKILLGFDVRPNNLDPTVVKISYPSSIEGNWSVYVFTLSYLKWDQLDINRLPHNSIRFKRSTQAVVGHERILADIGDSYKHYLLVSFDMINHCFQVIDIPDIVTQGLSAPLYLSIDGGSITSASAIMTMPSNHFLKLLGFNNHDLPIVEAATGHIMDHTANLYAGFWSRGLMSDVDLVKVFSHGL